MAGLYIHIPFCKSRCSYCDFHSGVQLALLDRFVDALRAELTSRVSYLKNETLETIYFGGGTPSLLSTEHLSAIFESIQSHWDISNCKEITLEANPDDLSEEKLEKLSELPINRLSIGIQSFNNNELKILRRRHTAQQAVDVVKRAQKYFSNISIDLMYGLPEQTISSWQNTISEALALNIQHVSAYHLTYEEGTLLERKRREGHVSPVLEEESIAMYHLLQNALHEKGIEQYEISNFAIPGFYSRHNSSYWKGINYLGIGPSAHSFDGESRQWNIANTLQHITGIEQGTPRFEKEVLSETDKYNELIMISLRTTDGISLERVEQEFGTNAKKELLKQSVRFIKSGIMLLEENHLRLSSEGLFLSDGIITDLMQEQ
ncbi:radical SAM family heme chaperone HemW [Paludibacter sp.]|uniref:radical SAM family heme chaperone HemW n=1 Tax=Paludibacter sp. TaxID=1898105 RepID=UPI0013521DA8|nr:radical SAM family heme chaperone HemW [Paludibacter sp.]MTK51986.1 radical SAM family heme chaperone HemW [Paludibacter sp.]